MFKKLLLIGLLSLCSCAMGGNYVEIKGHKIRVEVVEDVIDTVNLAEADIIVSGGRGLGNPEGFKVVEELALLLDGAVGASRSAVDSGWTQSFTE